MSTKKTKKVKSNTRVEKAWAVLFYDGKHKFPFFRPAKNNGSYTIFPTKKDALNEVKEYAAPYKIVRCEITYKV